MQCGRKVDTAIRQTEHLGKEQAEQNVEMAIPGKPNSRLQQYRLTAAGAARLNLLRKGRNDS